MWKRLPLRDRGNKGRQSLQIGSPTLLESTYDEHQLNRAQDLSPTEEPQLSPYYNADIRPSRARRDVENELNLPDMNFKKPSQDPKSYRPSVAASSVYSQPDDHISPPSSPYRRPAYDDGQVSPIEEHSPHGLGEASGPNKSNIPVPRKATPSSVSKGVTRTKEWTQNVGKSGPMLWDVYSGEPTFDGAGKPSQVKPGEFDLRAGLKPTQKLKQPSLVTNGNHKAGFKEKASRLAQRGLAVDTRPPWKGSSGRQAIVNAPEDKPGQTVPQPRRPEEKRVQSPVHKSLNNAASPTATNVARSPETRQVTALAQPENNTSGITGHDAFFEQQFYASVPAGPSPPLYINPDKYPSPVSPPLDRNVTPTQDHPYSPNAITEPRLSQHPALRKDNSRPAYADNDSPPRKIRNSPSSRTVEDSPGQHLDSRFSWTTTATSTYQRSPPSSPPPPMPTKYLNDASPSVGENPSGSSYGAKASILDRTHPTRRMGVEPSSPPMSGRSFSAGSTLRKPVSSTLAVQPPSPGSKVIQQQFPMADWRSGVSKQRAVSLAPSTLSTGSQVKSLPKTPQELSSPDLIASLQAQQNDLSQQRRNVQRIIADLERPEAKNPLHNSFKVIREREKQLETLKLELADVIRKDYELGMRLHRAWKRKERDDPNTPGSIFWVRRATAS